MIIHFRLACLLTVLCHFFICAGHAATIFPFGSTWKMLKGLSEASSPDARSWRTHNFNDSGWSTASAPFWYGDFQAGGTVLNEMRSAYTSIFLRRQFVIEDVNSIQELELVSASDDGFIAWINGVEVARFNMPAGEIPYDGVAAGALAEPIPLETNRVQNLASILVNGMNVIAVQAFNASLNNSSDFVFDQSLVTKTDEVPPVVASIHPLPLAKVRELTSVEVVFDEPVAGVDAADLLINGQPATNLVVFAEDQYVFEFAAPSPGAVNVTWSAGHAIRDRSAAGNPFSGKAWSYTYDPNAPPLGMIISEFMASNDNTLNDEDGSASDWIEIHNAGSETENLEGWFLTDDRANWTKWRIPAISVAPSGFLVVFASDKNRTNTTGRLHANFQLSTGGEFLALVDPQTNIVDQFSPSFPPQQTDISFGRDRANPDITGYFTVPTPGAPNTVSGAGFSSVVEFSRTSGTFTGTITVELRTASTNAVLHYTLDGSMPDETSPIYSAPIQISTTRQVRARSFTPGLLPGPPRSETFVSLAANVVNFTSDLPILVIHNFGGGAVPANVDQFAHISIFEPGANGRSSLMNAPSLSSRAGINIRGSSTEGISKRSFAVEWWDEFNEDLDLSPLGLPAESDWVLYAPNNFEPVLIHNPFMYQLSNEIGRYAPRTRFVEVYLNTSGGAVSSTHYNGVYVLMEKIKRGSDRVAVDKLEPEHKTPPEVTGGYMMKIDRLDPGDSGFVAAGMSIAYVDPKEEEIKLPERTDQRNYLRNYMNTFSTVLNGSNYRDPVNGYARYIDVDAWIDHHVLNVLAFNVDALRLSTYFYKEREGKLVFGPIWDFDRALGSTDGRDSNPTVWYDSGGTDFFNFPWWGRLFNDVNFWQRWVDRWQQLRTAQFSTAHLNGLIDQLTGIVMEAQPREASRWPGLTRPRGGSYQSEINLMKNWLRQRTDFIDGQLVPAPTLSHSGGMIQPGLTVTIDVPSGATVYYTTDGSDPRLSGGSVSASAKVYTGPITISSNSRIVARSRNPQHPHRTGSGSPPAFSPWSGVAAATFVTEALPLVVTEIMYHPGPIAAGENGSDPEQYEYIELLNRGAQPLNLAGVRFTTGIDFTFPVSGITTLAPGERVLVVKSLAAFQARYGSTNNVAGEYAGSLSNSGERLTLIGPFQEPILDFEYSDKWYPITDGHGFSLVAVDERAPVTSWSNPLQWRPSSQRNGSPAQEEGAQQPFPRVIVSEVMAEPGPGQSDAIELMNIDSTSADISGWLLTDNFDDPRRFRIPAGTVIPPGGFKVFHSADFGSGPAGFGLNGAGEEVYLFSANAQTNLTGYVHGFAFGGAPRGATYGRYAISTGAEHFVLQKAASLGDLNAGPRVGPLVITEIMYHPPVRNGATNDSVFEEFLELQNISDTPVSLSVGTNGFGRWALDGGVRFTFPVDAVIPAGGVILVVGFDPTSSPGDLENFRNRYGVDASVPVFGPYAGRLGNTDDSLQVLQPLVRNEAEAQLVFLLSDRVDYRNSSPWPSDAGGAGMSLQRKTVREYGNDPANWVSADPTAGRAVELEWVDNDDDGLPDDWEILHGLNPQSGALGDGADGDPDGDGATNLEEYLAGTNPRDPNNYLKVESISQAAGTVRLRFKTVAAKSYSVVFRDNPTSGEWRKLGDIPAQTDAAEVEMTDTPGTAPVRVYRVVTPALP